MNAILFVLVILFILVLITLKRYRYLRKLRYFGSLTQSKEKKEYKILSKIFPNHLV